MYKQFYTHSIAEFEIKDVETFKKAEAILRLVEGMSVASAQALLL